MIHNIVKRAPAHVWKTDSRRERRDFAAKQAKTVGGAELATTLEENLEADAARYAVILRFKYLKRSADGKEGKSVLSRIWNAP